MFKFKNASSFFLSLSLRLIFLGMLSIILLYIYSYSQLPNAEALNDVKLQVPMRVFTQDGKLISEFGEQRRHPISLEEVPQQLIQAVLATEDQRFFEHHGVDFPGLVRATIHIIQEGKKTQGGSTITMQVARNFFLTRQKTFTRKINEILLAIKIERELTKQQILELYLNKIYLGNRAYGVAAAAQVYYGKPLSELRLPELAMLAGLPKAPSASNPLANPTAAKQRRNHVLRRMYEQGYIDAETLLNMVDEPLTAKYHGARISVSAPHVAEMVRQIVIENYGEEAAYTAGFNVFTTVNSEQQCSANRVVREGLLAYDQRHGYRGPEQHFTLDETQPTESLLPALSKIRAVNGLRPALVAEIAEKEITALLADGTFITVEWPNLVWARKQIRDGVYAARPKQASEIVKRGDLIRLQKTNNNQWRLAQLPEIEGALIAIEPRSGSIKAMVGGFDFQSSHFNRVLQAQRQSGSSFKPFVYSAALAKGFTMASIINDAPIVLEDSGLNSLWRPQNDNRQFYGPTRLRTGLIRSRNLVSIRLLQAMGIEHAINYLTNFGFDKSKLPPSLSLALGAGLVTPIEMASAYTVLANGGYKIEPHIIDQIIDNNDQSVFQSNPAIACPQCRAGLEPPPLLAQQPPQPIAPRVISPQIAYLITTALRDVIQKGTGRGAKVLNRNDLAGKTGTTNEQKDVWFTGYNADLVTITWLGFDQPRSIHEYAARAVLPIWVNFMRDALKNTPEKLLQQPPGIVNVRIDPKTGLLAHHSQDNAIFELFRQNHAPKIYSSSPTNTSTQNEDMDAPLF